MPESGVSLSAVMRIQQQVNPAVVNAGPREKALPEIQQDVLGAPSAYAGVFLDIRGTRNGRPAWSWRRQPCAAPRLSRRLVWNVVDLFNFRLIQDHQCPTIGPKSKRCVSFELCRFIKTAMINFWRHTHQECLSIDPRHNETQRRGYASHVGISYPMPWHCVTMLAGVTPDYGNDRSDQVGPPFTKVPSGLDLRNGRAMHPGHSTTVINLVCARFQAHHVCCWQLPLPPPPPRIVKGKPGCRSSWYQDPLADRLARTKLQAYHCGPICEAVRGI